MTAKSFDDVLLVPADMSTVRSRQDCSTQYLDEKFELMVDVPIISSNMDTIYSPLLSKNSLVNGALSAVHRFCSIEENIDLFKKGSVYSLKPWVSFGLGDYEMQRALALHSAGAKHFILDVANGANVHVLEQAKQFLANASSANLAVGNFCTLSQVDAFQHHLGNKYVYYKVNVGSGSICKTSVVTGVGLPTFETIKQFQGTDYKIIADGGHKNTGDVCKSLAASSSLVMLGNMFAGTKEAAGAVYTDAYGRAFRRYQGSASKESYQRQNKESAWRVPEGEEISVLVDTDVASVVQNVKASLQSSMSYLDAHNLTEYKNNAKFIDVSNNSFYEKKIQK